MTLLERNPILADAFFEQIARATKRAADEAKHRAEVLARYRAQAVDEDLPHVSEATVGERLRHFLWDFCA